MFRGHALRRAELEGCVCTACGTATLIVATTAVTTIAQGADTNIDTGAAAAAYVHYEPSFHSHGTTTNL